jgi:hypothetical protein
MEHTDLRVPLSDYGCKRNFVVSDASDEPPTQMVKLPGSTTHLPSAFQISS